MGIAKTPSAITLPRLARPWPSILDFLVREFPHIAAERWASRMHTGKLLDETGAPIGPATPYIPATRIYYFREVEQEPVIPFAEQILFCNHEILVADKPHFLPVVPGGRYVNECLEHRLRERTGIRDLQPVHRIDRETAGLVLFSLNPETRSLYHELFAQGRIEKQYEAIAEVRQPVTQRRWRIENRIARGEPSFHMRVVPGPVNARSEAELLDVRDNRARFRLRPHTGKTHQLRVHLSSLGFPIVNDRYYPQLQAQTPDDFTRPLQLLAKRLRFRDPVSGDALEFHSQHELLWS